MIKLGLTGTRFSGKDLICKHFKKLGIPIFDADTVIKFILLYNEDVKTKIREEVGSEIFKYNYITSEKIIEYRNFDQVLDIIEDDLLNAYGIFCVKNKGLIYSIFNSSILLEKKWNMHMDYTISVYAPYIERVERAKETYGRNSYTKINTILSKEVNELDKNKTVDFVIHNYGKNDISKQILDIDQLVIDNYLKNLIKDN
jgi:dephospho-CoA kinase